MNEQAIIQQILGGDTAAFARLVEAYQQRLFAFIGRYVAQQMDVEEIAEDVMVKAYQHLGEYDGAKGSLWTWLSAIAQNETLNFLKRRSLTTVSMDDDGADADFDLGDTTDDKAVEMLVRAVDGLEDLDRTMVEMFYYEERSLNDVAATLGTTPGNVATRLHRIRKRLYKDMRRLLNIEH